MHKYNNVVIIVWGIIMATMMFAAGKATAADIQTTMWNDKAVITIGDEFVVGDYDDFKDLAELVPEITTVVLLDSPGGAIDGFRLANYIYDNDYDIIVAGECTSYCAFIAVADKDYVMEKDSVLLFHSSYIPTDFLIELIDKGYCNDDNTKCGIPYKMEGIVQGLTIMNREALAEMVEYLFKVGVSQELILHILDKGPTEFYQITGE